LVSGDEAHHLLRVRRLEKGDAATITDGKGRSASVVIEATYKLRDGWQAALRAERLDVTPPASPAVVVLSSPPKGDRLSEMIDGLSQVGAHAWHPLITQRTIVDPREGKLERLLRVTIESLKQCGRAHLLALGERVELGSLRVGEGMLGKSPASNCLPTLIVADVSGVPIGQITPAATYCLLVGPEGGFSPDELTRLDGLGAQRLRLGPHVLRSETAPVVACAALMSVTSSTSR
jgi:16S rRNA (uracil1498-N3)-methyltransferase